MYANRHNAHAKPKKRWSDDFCPGDVTLSAASLCPGEVMNAVTVWKLVVASHGTS
jgi:hypothetical protein